jgi:thioredoxin reductase
MPDRPRIAILGAGPIGLEAAIQARQVGYPVTVYERGDIGENLTQWGHVRLFSPFGWNVTPLGLELIRRENPKHPLPGSMDLVTGLEYRDSYLVPLSLTPSIASSIRTKTHVLSIGKVGCLRVESASDPKRLNAAFRLLLRDENGAERVEEADVVLDCSGNYGRHSWMGEGGIPAIGELSAEKSVSYLVDDILGKKKAHYAGKSIIVIGGGYSAATTVCALAELAEQNSATWTIWITRGPRSTPLPRNPNDTFRERDRLAARANNLATRGDGNVEFISQAAVQEIVSHGPDKGFRVVARCLGKTLSWEVDRVIGNVGYLPDEWMTRELHLFSNDKGSVKRPEPNYYMLGMKSYGRDSDFLMKRGFEQVKEVMGLIAARKW